MVSDMLRFRPSHGLLFALALVAPARGEVDFAHEVLPILRERCAECHSNGTYKGGVSIDTREALLGSDDVVVVGDASQSLFIELLSVEDPDDRMPKKADPLPAEEIAVLTRWVDGGLKWEEGFTFRERTWTAPLAPREVVLPGPEGANPVDQLAGAYFRENGVRPPATISDAAFLRRVSLDLVGLLPSPDEFAAFEADAEPGKRLAKIDELLGRDIAYADHWMTFWNDLLRNAYAGTGFIDGGRSQITAWLYDALKGNKPYDDFVSELMAPTDGGSEGFIKGIKWRGNVNASQVQEVQYAQNVSQVFFGENLKCASCHDSFINDWKLEDAYGMASIIAGKPLEMFRCDKPTGKFAEAKFLFDELGTISADASREERLKQAAALATSGENGRLARTVVNRLWARLMGRGLVEPVDVMSNRPWDEDLLDWLAWDLAENGYDLKRTLRWIMGSQTYQGATVPPPAESEEYVFKGADRQANDRRAVRRCGVGADRDGAGQDRGEGRSQPASARSGGGARPRMVDLERGQPAAGQRERDLGARVRARRGRWSRRCYRSPVTTNTRSRSTGSKVGADGDWTTVEHYPVKGLLKSGANSIRVIAKNHTDALRTPPGWRWRCESRSQRRLARQRVGERCFAWKTEGGGPVVVVGGPDSWNGITAEFDQAPAGERLPVRASLVKSTLLMRALGRPNREQVVTTRPAELTTLQALELNNGAEFVGYLNRGASKWFGEFGADREGMVESLYRRALGRAPGEMERAVALDLLGEPATEAGVADLLWTVLMLPEFQIVQ